MATDNTTTKPILQEIASIERDFNRMSFGNVLRNDDDTLITRGAGKGLKIYDELERDCHASAVLDKRKLAVVARPWDVTPASESDLDVQAADLVRKALERIQFDLITLNMLDANLKGFSVGEVMWEVVDGMVLPKDVIARNQVRFAMTVKGEARLLTRESMLDGEELPARKFIVHRTGAKDGSPYGRGLGSKLFWPVMFKRQGITFWMVFADKFGSPTAHGKYPAGALPAEQTKLLAALQAISQDAGIITPEGMSIELLEAARSGSVDTYEKLIRYMDEQISKAVLGETMSTTAAPAGLGSGQADVQNDVRLEVSKADADLFSATLRNTLIQWIVEYNLPGAGVPAVYRNFSDGEDLKARADRDAVIYGLGFEPTEQYIADTYGEGWVKRAVPAAAPGGGFPGSAPGADGGTDPQDLAFAEPGALNADTQDAIVEAADAIGGEWKKLMGNRVDDLRSMLDDTGDLAMFRERMDELLDAAPNEHLQEAIARANFAGHVMGRGKEQKKPGALAKVRSFMARISGA